MKIAFLTEMNFTGKIPVEHPNMRTEFAWMYALDADHYSIHNYSVVNNYDHVFIIFPKGSVYLNACGSKLTNDDNPISNLLSANIALRLKQTNKNVYYIQEGPHWLFNDYELVDQINFYNMLASCDAVFAHNESDANYYNGLLNNIQVHVMPTLLIDDCIKDIVPQVEEKVIIGGNLARWYGGFESYIIAQEFKLPIWGQTSHATRDGEDQLINLLPRVYWLEWMKQLSSFKFAVHLMPTVAAGTFSLNCAYFGIPCIGNRCVDTQRLCHPDLSVDVHDLKLARELANALVGDNSFYKTCSTHARENYRNHFSKELFVSKLFNILK